MGDKVVSLLNGRLGNILFELAAGMSYAKRTSKEFHCVIKDVALTPFSDYPNYYSRFVPDARVSVQYGNYTVINENQSIAPETIKEVQGDVILDGYFQSEMYIDTDYIREKFRIDDETKSKLTKMYDGISDGVGMSVRRGDYLKYRNLFNVMSKRYYEDMYRRYFRGLKCFITSDDVEWCRNNLEIDNVTYIEETDENTLFALAMCRHHILSCSTFSWWGSWLMEMEDSINIVPSPWFGRNSGLNSDFVSPERWTKTEITEEYLTDES